MGQLDILKVFIENPNKNFHIREISAQLNIPKTTVSYHIHELLRDKLIVKEKKDTFPSFRANNTNEIYRFQKLQEAIREIIKSKVLDYIEEETNPRCIILFGSYAKAEYDKNSDIDLFVQAPETKIAPTKYEKKLGHKINVLFEPELEKLSKELLNNIVNGVKLRGFIKIK